MSNEPRLIATYVLGVLLVIIVIGVIVIELAEGFTPDVLQVIGGASVGALATLATGNAKPPPST